MVSVNSDAEKRKIQLRDFTLLLHMKQINKLDSQQRHTVIESFSLIMLSSLLFLRALLSLYCACIYYENMHSTVPSITNIIPSGILLKKEGKCLNQSKTYLKNGREGLQCLDLFQEKYRGCPQAKF